MSIVSRLVSLPGDIWGEWAKHWLDKEETDTSMKILRTKSGVTISTVKPEFVEALVDVIKDLASGDAVLLYGPGFELPVVTPQDNLRDEMDRLLHADATYPGSYSEDYQITEWWQGASLPEEVHRQIWGMIEQARPGPPPIAPEPDIPGEPH